MAKTESINIETTSGQSLSARIGYAAGAHRGWAIFAHCFTCSKDSLAAARVSQELAMLGIGVLRLDFTGLGQSSGGFWHHQFNLKYWGYCRGICLARRTSPRASIKISIDLIKKQPYRF